jgi:PKD repeat protein
LGDLDPFADVGGPYLGAVGADVSFDGSGSMDLDGDIVSYDWNFGDGIGTSTLQSPDYPYATSGIYPVTLTVTDDDDFTDTSTTKAVIGYGGIPPEADAGGPYDGVPGEPITFDCSGSRDLDSHITVGCSWDFGDDSSGGGEKPIHAYTKAGVYDVVLQVTDKDGKVASSTTTATIDDDGGVSSVGSSGGSSTCFINTLFD